MGISVSDLIWSKKFKIFVLVLIILISTSLEVYLHLTRGISIGFTHFYYLFLIPVAFLFHRKAVLFGIYLAGIHLIFDAVVTGGSVSEVTILRSGMFVVVSYVVGYIFEVIDQRYVELVAYVAERSMRVQSVGQMGPDEAGDIAPRTVAGTTIQKLKTERNVKGLITALRHPDVEVRYRAAIALGDVGGAGAIQPLTEALKDENSGVRWEAAEALGKIGEPALTPLAHALHDEDDDVRWRAAIALGEIRDEKAVAPLIMALADEDEYVRKRAAYSLSRLGELAVEPLLYVINEGEEPVCEGALAALAAMGDEAPVHMQTILDASDASLRPVLEASILKFNQYIQADATKAEKS